MIEVYYVSQEGKIKEKGGGEINIIFEPKYRPLHTAEPSLPCDSSPSSSCDKAHSNAALRSVADLQPHKST
jgi:hypothetical protein